MKRISNYRFVPGHVYIFSRTVFDGEGAVWGIFDRRVGNGILLEVLTFDLKSFLCRRRLPARFRFVREAVHEEVRDFAFNQGAADAIRGLCG